MAGAAIKARVGQLFRHFGYEIVQREASLAADEVRVLRRVEPFTMTSPSRIVGLMDAVKYVVSNEIPGAIVECGVWRGGSMMAAALTLIEAGDTSRDLALFDTFEGMTTPGRHDRLADGTPASDVLGHSPREQGNGYWCIAGLDDVRTNVLSTGYPPDRIRFVSGRVEDTLPLHAPDTIALLRLDTDWYESTRHELAHLYGRLADHGILIIDDYGHWQGARQAVDEFFAGLPLRPFLTRLDYTGRLAVKPGGSPAAPSIRGEH
jgi:hypothetical protein